MKKTNLKLVASLSLIFCVTGMLKAANLTEVDPTTLPPGIVKIETDCDNKKNPNQGVVKLFDGNTNNKWFADGGPDKGFPCYIKWEYKTEQKIKSYTLVSANDVPGRDPKSWKLYGYNGDKEILLDEQTDVKFERKESKKFSIKKAASYKTFKIVITAVAADNANTPPQLAEIAIDNGEAQQQVAGNAKKRPIALDNSNIETIETDCDNKKNPKQTVDKLFDGSLGTKWFGDGGPENGYPCYVAWDYKTEQNIKSYTLISGNDSPTRDPKAWNLYGFDGKKYVLIDKQSNVVFGDRQESKTFKLKNPANYKSLKFEILSVAADNASTPPQLTGLEIE